MYLDKQNKLHANLEYDKSDIYKFIMNFNIQHYKDYDSQIFGSFYNFVYNNLYTDNITLCVFFYNVISKYLIN